MADYPVILIVGGARSGKSHYGENLVEQSGKTPVYLATAEARDDEMLDRINIHQQRRGDHWQTIEESLEIASIIEKISSPDHIILVDCLTLWLSNLMTEQKDVASAMKRLLTCLEQVQGPVIMISNEVGLGIVPNNALARAFRDEAGRINQAVASTASDVLFMAAGLPICLKKKGKNTYDYDFGT